MEQKRRRESHYLIRISSPLEDREFLNLISGIKGFEEAQIYCLGNDRRKVGSIIDEFNKFFSKLGLDVRFSFERKKVIESVVDQHILKILRKQPVPHLGDLATLCNITKKEVILRCKALKKDGKLPSTFKGFKPNS